MDRNTQTGWREDEQRKSELQDILKGEPVPSRDDQHEQEDIDPHVGRRPGTDVAVGDEPSVDEVQDRTEFARFLRPSELPTTAANLRRTAEEEGAPDWVLEALDRLAPDEVFETIGEAWDAAS